MATRALKQVTLVKTRDGRPAEYETIAAATGVNVGDICVKANNALAAVSDGAVVCTHLATFDADNDVIPGAAAYTGPYLKIKPDDTFEMSVYHATPASAVFADADLDAQPDYEIIKATVSGVTAWCVEKSATSTPAVRVIGRIESDSATDLYPRVLVQFIRTVVQ